MKDHNNLQTYAPTDITNYKLYEFHLDKINGTFAFDNDFVS